MSLGDRQRPAISVLLVEDDLAAAHLTREALRDARIPYQVHLVTDGEAALKFLYRHTPFLDAPRPDLILLDLSLPKIDGRQVLAKIKEDASLSTIPVVVLTGSDDRQDINDAYRHHVSCYITKPSGLNEYFTAVRSLKELWFNAVSFPDEPNVEAADTSD
ncbi:MAG: response regulator [Bryobacteraceae bacterium]|jgi:two-component system response regulator